MIFITGDCHADWKKFSKESFQEQAEMTRDDFVIVCGDFGLWHDDKTERWWFKWFEEKNFTVLFVDGNHENFDRLYSEFEDVDFHGGKAHKIRENIYHLMRGYVFDLCGKKFFAFGGASSHDIDDGILDRKDFQSDRELVDEYNRRTRRGEMLRINHISWWKEEVPNIQEYEYALDNLRCHRTNNFLITHEAPAPILSTFGYPYNQTSFEIFDFLRYGYFDKHYFGHYHINQDFGKSECVYDIIKKIW